MMVQLACADNPAFIPSDIEIYSEPPSYTADTLRAFRTLLGPKPELWFVLGGDALASLPRWHHPEHVVELARLAVVMRPGMSVDLNALAVHLPGIADRVTLIDGPGLDISSSVLRQRLASGQPVRYQLPDSVLEYIRAQRLYGAM